eukprot:TRINITY_DN18280_c0_g1_i1.p1 TRINITY_DN18280_c0_g1~~TRINITY_DN18280_c0_g1_i1.p1  ORF type:complete len:1050 (-),score=304.47 TRINITY_DN18280_c0_g1_i1:1-3150(-)
MFKGRIKGASLFDKKKVPHLRSHKNWSIVNLPPYIEASINFIKHYGINIPNLFSDTRYEKLVEEVKESTERGKTLNLSHLKSKGEDVPVKVAAGLVRSFLNEADPLCSASHDQFIKAMKDHPNDRVAQAAALKEQIGNLAHRAVIQNFLNLFHQLTIHADENKMDTQYFASKFGSYFLFPTVGDLNYISEIVTILIDEYEYFFNDGVLNSTPQSAQNNSQPLLELSIELKTKQLVDDWTVNDDVLIDALHTHRLAPIVGDIMISRSSFIQIPENSLLDQIGRGTVNTTAKGLFNTKFSWENLKTEEDREIKFYDDLNDIEEDPYVSTEPILIRDNVKDDETSDEMEIDETTDETVCEEEPPIEVNTKPKEKKHKLNMSDGGDSFNHAPSEPTLIRIPLIHTHSLPSAVSHLKLNDIQNRMKRASVQMRKTNTTTMVSNRKDHKDEIWETLTRVESFITSFLVIDSMDTDSLSLQQLSFLKDLANVVDKHLIYPTPERDPRILSFNITQALIARLSKILDGPDENQEDDDGRRQSLIDVICTCCSSIQNVVSNIKKNWHEFEQPTLLKIGSCLSSIEEFFIHIESQSENRQAIDPRLPKLKSLLDSLIDELDSQFTQIEKEVIEIEKWTSTQIIVFLKRTKEINKQLMHKQPEITITEEDIKELHFLKESPQPTEQLQNKLAKITHYILFCVRKWKETLGIYKSETTLDTLTKPMNVLTHSIINYTQTASFLRNLVGPFWEDFKNALEITKLRDEISRVMKNTIAIISAIRNIIETDRNKFTTAGECIYAASIVKEVKEMLSDMTKPDRVLAEFKIDNFASTESQDNSKKLEILKAATIKSLFSILDSLVAFKSSVNNWVNNNDGQPLAVFLKNLKLVSLLFRQIYQDCCAETKTNSNPRASHGDLSKNNSLLKLQATAISFLDQAITKLDKIDLEALSNETLCVMAIFMKALYQIKDTLQSKKFLEEEDMFPLQFQVPTNFLPISTSKIQILIANLSKNLPEIVNQLQIYKTNLAKPNSEKDLIQAIKFARRLMEIIALFPPQTQPPQQ